MSRRELLGHLEDVLGSTLEVDVGVDETNLESLLVMLAEERIV